MESSQVIASDKATVVIQVNPQVAQDAVICNDGQQVTGAYHNTALKGFFNAQPKALGTVQIMIGVMVFILGIVLTANYDTFYNTSVDSGITYWGSVIYISTGSLSVAAQNKLHPCVVKASLGMNVISAITAAISIIFTGKELGSPRFQPNCYYNRYDCTYSEGFGLGIIGVFLVFSTLQFIVSIFISGFACKATCNTDSTVVNVALK